MMDCEVYGLLPASFPLSHIHRHVGSSTEAGFAVEGKESWFTELGQVIMVKTNGCGRMRMAIETPQE